MPRSFSFRARSGCRSNSSQFLPFTETGNSPSETVQYTEDFRLGSLPFEHRNVKSQQPLRSKSDNAILALGPLPSCNRTSWGNGVFINFAGSGTYDRMSMGQAVQDTCRRLLR